MRIAILMTVFNRRETTLRCLRQVKEAVLGGVEITTFMTNDGCTDGTPEAVSSEFPEVIIVQGDGSLFWNRGMYAAWKEASKQDFDAYLWLNDDTFIYPDTISRMVECSQRHGDNALIVGSTCAVGDPDTITYGGWIKGKLVTDVSADCPCDTVSGNIVLIPRSVFNTLGLNDPYYRHAAGDTDYGLRAREAGIEVWVAKGILGECNLHEQKTVWMDPQQPLKKRWKHLFSPTGNNPFEYFHFRRRHYGFVPACLTFVSNIIHVLFPRLWTR